MIKKLQKVRLVIFLLLITAISTFAQSISGKIVDSKGDALVGASVSLKGTTKGVSTGADGVFNIPNVDKGKQTLLVSFIGYVAKEFAVNVPSNTLTIVLDEDVNSLNEVVVIGYGSQIKRDLTGSVQTVNATELKDLPVSQITQNYKVEWRAFRLIIQVEDLDKGCRFVFVDKHQF